MFRTSIVHLQELSYAVCYNLVCLDTSCCYVGEGRTAGLQGSSFFALIRTGRIETYQIYFMSYLHRFRRLSSH